VELNMGKETIREGKWYAEAILNDLVETGKLSAKSVGCDIVDRAARRFFYDKVPFALVGWQQDSFAMVAFAPEMDNAIIENIVEAFIKIFEYPPFVKYEVFQNSEDFIVFEWAKKDAHLKMIDITALPNTKNIHKLSDKYQQHSRSV